jgi:hypothetical protein
MFKVLYIYLHSYAYYLLFDMILYITNNHYSQSMPTVKHLIWFLNAK